MSNLADLQLTFLTPCERCAGLLFGQVAFCPYCGGAAAVIFGNRTPAAANEIDPAENDFSDSTLGLLAKRQMARPGTVRRQAASGTVALFLLIVLALVLGYNQLGNRDDDTPDARSLIAKLGLAAPRQATNGLLRVEEPMPSSDPDAGRGRLPPAIAVTTAIPVLAAASEAPPMQPAAVKPNPPIRTAAAKVEPPASPHPAASEQPTPRTAAACNDMLSALALCSPAEGIAPAPASTAAASAAPTHEAALDALQVKPNR